MQDLIDQLVAKTKKGMTDDEISDVTRLREESTTAHQCIDICFKADDHLKENVSVIDNHATRDNTIQFLVSTKDKTIHGQNRGYGFRIGQIGGHLSYESVQQLSTDVSRISIPNAASEVAMPTHIPSNPQDTVKRGSAQDRHSVRSRSTKDVSEPAVGSKTVSRPDQVKHNSSQKRSSSEL